MLDYKKKDTTLLLHLGNPGKWDYFTEAEMLQINKKRPHGKWQDINYNITLRVMSYYLSMHLSKCVPI